MVVTGTDEIRNSITVTFDYRVIFRDDALRPEDALLADVLAAGVASTKARALVFLDEGLCRAHRGLAERTAAYFRAHASQVELAAGPVVVSGGEDAKRDSRVFDRCVRALSEAGLDRHSYAVVIGGGAVLDAVGFAASVVHRGVRLVRLPSTVLSQNDAGLGVKCGIDYEGRKNFLGCFYPAHAIVNDFTLLRTLGEAAWRDGTAEAVKVALIRDPAFFDWIERNSEALGRRDEAAMRHLIRRCAELHLAHIATSGDAFERGSARPLDFGHWSAHRLEQLSDFRISHGHGVAVGIAIDASYSHAIGLLDGDSAKRIVGCLRQLGFRLDVADEAGIGGKAGMESLLRGIADFREHLGGPLSLTMLRGVGRSCEIGELEMPIMRDCCERVLLRETASILKR